MTTLAPYRTARRFLTGLAIASVLLTACGKDDPAGPGQTTTIILVGIFNGSDASRSGSVAFTINNTTVTGTLKVVTPAAATIALTGTYNTGTRALTASGGGYTFTGTYDGTAVISGTFTGPAASQGTFRGRTSTANARSICGTFTSQTGSDDGIFNFAIDGTTLSGTATTEDGTVVVLNGTVSGTGAISIVNPNNPSGAPLATGNITGNNASGTFNDGGGNQGTWTGSVCS